jgi:hypothetical protein
MGLSEMKVKSLRRQVKGRGTMRARKMNISVTNRRKTWKEVSMEATLRRGWRGGRGRAREQQRANIAIDVLLGGRCPQKAFQTGMLLTKL